MTHMFRALALHLRRQSLLLPAIILASTLLACSTTSTVTVSGSTSSAAATATATSAPPTATSVPPTATPVPPTATPVPPGNLAITAYCYGLGVGTVGPCAVPIQSLCVSDDFMYFHLYNNGGQAVNWTSTVMLSGSAGTTTPPTLVPTNGTVSAGQTVTVQANQPPGGYGGGVDFIFNWTSHSQTFDVYCVMP
jgi:ABC-type Fe3+-hydroxamate transport system substrate-binding protein